MPGSIHRAFSGANLITRDPNNPKADLEVQSKPFSFNMVTLTAYGNDRDACSMLEALVEKADLSDGENSSTKEMAGRRSSVDALHYSGRARYRSPTKCTARRVVPYAEQQARLAGATGELSLRVALRAVAHLNREMRELYEEEQTGLLPQ